MKKSIILAIILLFISILSISGQEPKTAEDFYKRGKDFSQNGDRKRAEADFTSAIKLDPSHAQSYAERAFFIVITRPKQASDCRLHNGDQTES